MRFAKLILISIIFFFLLLTAFSMLMPSQVNVSRAIDINSSVDTLKPYINNLQNWKKWYANYDSSATAETGNGHPSLKINNTVITLAEISANRTKAFWQTGRSSALEGSFNFFPKNSDSSSTLQWNFVQKVKWYPWEKIAALASAKSLGAFMERSLDKLKKEVERSPER